MGLVELSSALWRERELLEALRCTLEEQRLLVTAGRSQRLDRSAGEVESVLTELRRTELLRAMEADAAAAQLNLAPNPSLGALAAAAGEPWEAVLSEHRRALLEATAAISELAEGNRALLESGYRAASAALLTDAGSAPAGG